MVQHSRNRHGHHPMHHPVHHHRHPGAASVGGDAGGAGADASGTGGGAPQQQYTDDWYTYAVAVGSLAAGVSGAVNLQIQQDSEFELVKLTASGNLHGAAAPFTNGQIVEVNMSITDNGSGRILMNAPIPLADIAGNGGLPFILPVSRIFKPNSTILFNFQNYSAANTYDNIFVALLGRKIFKFS